MGLNSRLNRLVTIAIIISLITCSLNGVIEMYLKGTILSMGQLAIGLILLVLWLFLAIFLVRILYKKKRRFSRFHRFSAYCQAVAGLLSFTMFGGIILFQWLALGRP